MRWMALLCVLVACGDDDVDPEDAGTDVATDTTSVDAPIDATTDAPVDADAPPAFIGGDERPTRVIVPPGYDSSVPTPVLVLLHGYTANGFAQNAYFGMTRKAGERGLLLLAPDGLMDGLGNRHWNATPACCGAPPATDDLAYLTGLLDELEAGYNVDTSRVYFMGHSNGGFMSYRMACDLSDRVTAIASLAGATFDDPDRCEPARPISALQIHGTADGTVRFEGGSFAAPYPSAMVSAQRFADRAGCTDSALGDPIDFDASLAGAETTTLTYSGCMEGRDAALWTIEGGSHLPALSDSATDQILDWLLTHSL